MTNITFSSTDYPTIRRSLFDLHTRIYKNPNADEIKTCAKHLGLWHKKAVNANNDVEVELLMDYWLYGLQPNGFNMAEKYLRLHKNQLTEFEQALLSRMRLARYSVFQVVETNHLDTLTVVDVFIKNRFRLIDQHLAQSAGAGQVIAGYLIDLGDFCLQTGAVLPLNKALLQADEVIDALERVGDDNLADYLLMPANAAKLARAMIAASIRLGFTGSSR
jgi:hypothetical protein